MAYLYSKFLRLSSNDLVRGAVMAFLGVVVNGLYQLFQTCSEFTCLAGFSWGELGQAALIAGGSYLFKNLLTTKEGKFLGAIG